jgi:hypothetical protein
LPATDAQPSTTQIGAFISRWWAATGCERAAEEARGLVRWLRPQILDALEALGRARGVNGSWTVG